MSLLSNAASNAKTKKQLKEFKYEGVILYLAPHTLADGVHTVCPYSTPGCRDSCLYTAGRGNMRSVAYARMAKTTLWLVDRNRFVDQLRSELSNLWWRARKKKLKAVARLNGTSDIPWEAYMDLDDAIQFYDYTKNLRRMKQFLTGENWPSNYHLTYSYNEYTSPADVNFTTHNGGNVAVVFKDELPKEFMGVKVINGDEHDFRFRDPKGYIVGLKAKGRAKKDSTGFVVES